jgi:hypothetical protein
MRFDSFDVGESFLAGGPFASGETEGLGVAQLMRLRPTARSMLR